MEASCIVQTLRNSCKFFSESDKNIGRSYLKKSGERSRAILALLTKDISRLEHVYLTSFHNPRYQCQYPSKNTTDLHLMFQRY